MSSAFPLQNQVQSIGIEPLRDKIAKDNCYKPDWCNCTQDQYLYEIAMCVSNALYNLQVTYITKAICYSKLGMGDKALDMYTLLNKINHISFFLFAVKLQSYLNREWDTEENYISCEELNNIKKQLYCEGFDITCVYECLDLCGYSKHCETCN